MREGIIYEVQSILKVNEDARADDMVLYMAYLNLKGYGDKVHIVLANPKYRASNGLCGYASVSRARRKLQEMYPRFRPSKEQVEMRKKLAKEYRDFYKKPLCLNCE